MDLYRDTWVRYFGYANEVRVSDETTKDGLRVVNALPCILLWTIGRVRSNCRSTRTPDPRLINNEPTLPPPPPQQQQVGEAFRPVVPVLLVTLSYAVAFAYILADSYSQVCMHTVKTYIHTPTHPRTQ